MRTILIILLAAIAISLFVFGCGDETTDEAGKVVSSLRVDPTSASLEVGASQTFLAYASYTDGTSGVVIPSWSVSNDIGTVISAGYSGIFVASKEGTGYVNADYSGYTASAEVKVTPEAGTTLASIEITPAASAVRVGESVIFTAVGKTATGETLEISPGWSLSGDAVGTLSYQGTIATLETNAEGNATITCASNEITGVATVAVQGYTIEITVEVDTYVDENDPATTHGTDTSLKAGYVDTTDRRYETYLKFPLSAIPATATIESATIKVYPSSTGTTSLQLKKLDSAFSNATTWETRPTVSTFLASKTFSVDQYNQLSSSALTTLVGQWVSGAAANHGVAIVQEGTDNGTVVILSLENGSDFPLLYIEYDD